MKLLFGNIFRYCKWKIRYYKWCLEGLGIRKFYRPNYKDWTDKEYINTYHIVYKGSGSQFLYSFPEWFNEFLHYLRKKLL